MTYQEKVEWLLRCRKAKDRQECLEQEYRELKEVLQCKANMVSVCKGNWEQSCTEKNEERFREREMALAREQRKLAQLFGEVEAAISTLQDPLQRRVLRQVYLMDLSQDKICKIFHMGKSKVIRTHAEGIARIQIPDKEE